MIVRVGCDVKGVLREQHTPTVLLMPKRLPEHMEAQRERILSATLRCISELGIERTSISEIRKEADLSAGALYRHFSSKEEIIVETLRAASVQDAYLPDTWPEFVAAIASMADDHEFDAATIARGQLQVFAIAIRPGQLRDLLTPLIADALELVVAHVAKMESLGRIRLRMSPLQTALAIGAVKDGLVWSGLALDRSFHDVEADIAAALQCLVEPVA